MKILALLLLVLPSLSWSIPESQFEDIWLNRALPFFETMTKGSFKNAQNLTIKYSFVTKPENTRAIVIVPGRIEPAMKYAELLYDLKDQGADLFILDHQGQGESERLLADSNKGHVVRFSDYAKDLDQFVETVVKPNTSKPLYMIAHSMGGAIAVQYLSQRPETFVKVALSSPMLQIRSPFPEGISRGYAKFLVSIGKGNQYVTVAKPTGPYIPDQDTFEANQFTKSETRWAAFKHIFVTRPELVIWGPSNRWANEALKATKNIDKLPFHTPVLLFQATDDLIVRPERQNSFCQKNNCEMVVIPGSYHEVLMERDFIRDQVIAKIMRFFDI